ncbi:sigma-E processing peptidase SpoIIGA [Ferviditalea candida]|uniref:Sporulation sigma-E factor-processing peptidase n=1 Tax=Ferviditalea candida TaxID=3108399 RepID=A0ABU5ZEH9_9BACL|nr:sigma-E processing peptidase SpoIIGA [Paenibacillaceae bacterium T2]
MVIYLDLVFLTNFFIDATTLATTAWTRKIRFKRWRIAAAALLGASYVMMMFIPSLSVLFTFVVKFLFSVAMLLIAFGFGGLQNFVKNISVFYLINFVAAGGIFALHYLLLSSNDVMNGILLARTRGFINPAGIGLVFVIIMFTAMIFFYRSVFVSSKRRKQVTDYLAEVCVSIGERVTICTGLIDTGNQLYDPLTRTPVMVMESVLWQEDFPPAWMNLIQKEEVERILLELEQVDFQWSERLRLVPYRGVNKQASFMLALKPDKVVIRYRNSVTEVGKVLIGLDGGKLSSDGSYRAIIHPQLMESF